MIQDDVNDEGGDEGGVDEKDAILAEDWENSVSHGAWGDDFNSDGWGNVLDSSLMVLASRRTRP